MGFVKTMSNYLATKIKSYGGKINTNFHGNKKPKEKPKEGF